ncbi:putative biotin synthase [Mycobacterium xenopi 3993]|nr:putative biotin synthase [Mycobacterium xenopi 3993]
MRSAWLDIPSLVEAAKQTAKTGATEFCIVAAVRGPDERLMAQVAAGIEAIRNEVDINIACSLGMLSAEQVKQLAAMGVHRYNHNLETAARSFPRRHHPHLGRALEHAVDGARGRRCVAAASSAWAKHCSSAPNSPRSSPHSVRTRCR